METAPQLKASGLEGEYRILADFNGTVQAGTHSKHGVQFVTWDWDYDRTGVSRGHYFILVDPQGTDTGAGAVAGAADDVSKSGSIRTSRLVGRQTGIYITHCK